MVVQRVWRKTPMDKIRFMSPPMHCHPVTSGASSQQHSSPKNQGVLHFLSPPIRSSAAAVVDLKQCGAWRILNNVATDPRGSDVPSSVSDPKRSLPIVDPTRK